MSLLLFVSALSVQAAAQPAPVEPPKFASPSPVSLPPNAFTLGPIRPEARQLAVLIMPDDLYLDLVERSVLAGFDQNSAEFADLYAENPGLVGALRTELAKVTRGYFEKHLPSDHDRYARAIGSSFTTDEIEELVRFYGSTVGQKMIVAKYTGMDLSPVIEKLGADPNATLNESDIRALNRSVVAKALPHFDQSDLDALLAFGRKPVFARLMAFVPVMTALEVQISAELDPEFDAAIERAASEVMARFSVGQTTS